MRRLLIALLLILASISLAAQTSVAPMPFVKSQWFNGSVPCSGCQLYSYQAGTSTPQATYTDGTGQYQNANPTILDSNGMAQVWLTGNAYKFILKDANGVLLWSVDNVPAPHQEWRGTWSSVPIYAAGDIVLYSNTMYVSLLSSNVNHNPSSSATYWQAAYTLPSATTSTLGGIHLPTVTTYITGSGTYTTPTTATMLHVRLCGGGGGGGGGGTGGGVGGTGGTTTFGSSFLTATGGAGGSGGSGAPGSGGSASGGTFNISGSTGGNVTFSGSAIGGPGASGFQGFGGGSVGNVTAGGAGGACAGGGGGSDTTGALPRGSGGGGSGYVETWITSPSASYSYSVASGGAGGTAGTSGLAGGLGGTGLIIMEAY